ncbi:class I SAM-dependent methyltransferase [Actinokineospora sp. 24-640]
MSWLTGLGPTARTDPDAPRDQVSAWMTALPDVTARLSEGGTVAIAGCGTGWAALALARAFPAARVHGLDQDATAVAGARERARAAGLDDRVRFTVWEAVAPLPDGLPGYALVCLLGTMPRLGDPVSALTRVRSALEPGGAVLLAGVRPKPPGYPSGRDEGGRGARRPAPHQASGQAPCLTWTTAREWALRAGFARAVELPIGHPIWGFFRIDRGPVASPVS